MDFLEEGYSENRFAVAVEDDLKCAICLSVLREPLQCEMNEHYFCAPCIKRHLCNNANCPSCLDDLSLETLKKPSRYVTNHLGSLVIQCDHESRGCEEFVKLEDLARHLRECGYAPVSCQNDGCCEVVNKQDIFRHESELCERRRTDCHNCAEIKKEIGELKVAFEEFKAMKEIETTRKEISEKASRKEISELKVAFDGLEKLVGQIVDLKMTKINENLYRPPPSGNGIVVGGYDVGPRFPAQTVQGQPSYMQMMCRPRMLPTTRPMGHNHQQMRVAGAGGMPVPSHHIFTAQRPPARSMKYKRQFNQAGARGQVATNANATKEIAIPGKEALTPSILAQVSASKQKQMLGEHLFPLIQKTQPELAGKITGMLLEIDNSELLHMLEYRHALAAKVEEAVSVLHAHEARESKHT